MPSVKISVDVGGTSKPEPPFSVSIPIDVGEEECGTYTNVSNDSDSNDIIRGLSYRRYGDHDTDGDSIDDLGDDFIDPGCDARLKSSFWRFAAFQEKYLGPISPERAPGTWMILNAFAFSWSLSLGVYLILLYVWYGNEAAASKATTTDYLVWSLLTTLVWMVEISLRAAFPGLDTVLVVAAPAPSPTGSDEEEQVPGVAHNNTNNTKNNNNNNNNNSNNTSKHNPLQLRRTFTAEDSVVTIETIVQKRSKKHLTVITTELLLAVFFGIETIQDCWKHWHHRHGGGEQAATAEESDPDSEYYEYDSVDYSEGDSSYSMLEQQTDTWISVLAYAYMTYETYHHYKRSKKTKLNLQRSLSSKLLHHHQQQMQRQHQEELQRQMQELRQQHRNTNTNTNTNKNKYTSVSVSGSVTSPRRTTMEPSLVATAAESGELSDNNAVHLRAAALPHPQPQTGVPAAATTTTTTVSPAYFLSAAAAVIKDEPVDATDPLAFSFD